MAVIEIAEASVLNWDWDRVRSFIPDQTLRQGDICLQFFQDKRKFCGKTVKGCSSAPLVKQIIHQTQTVGESYEMHWRAYNAGGFLRPLFTMGEGKSKQLGDEIALAINIMKKQMEGEAVPLATFKGVVKIGAWGPVNFSSCTEDFDEIVVQIEVRPMSSPPFSLENAQPVDIVEEEDEEEPSSFWYFPGADKDAGGSKLSFPPLFAMHSTRSKSMTANDESWMQSFWASATATLGPRVWANYGRRRGQTGEAICMEWMPDKIASIWKSHDKASKESVVKIMEDEFRRDAIVFFNTFYAKVIRSEFRQIMDSAMSARPSQSLSGSTVSHSSSETLRNVLGSSRSLADDDCDLFPTIVGSPEMVKHAKTVLFLKRLFICFAVCGVYYNEAGNAAEIGEVWPYPMASILGHGSRVLIRLEDVSCEEFINFLISGDPKLQNWSTRGLPAPVMQRIAATHAVELNKGTGQLMERKLDPTDALTTFQILADGMSRKHLGINIPVGGLGNPSPMGPSHRVGFEGTVVELPQKGFGAQILNNVQGGHLYMRLDDFGPLMCQSSGECSKQREKEKIVENLKGPAQKTKAMLEVAELMDSVDTASTDAGMLMMPTEAMQSGGSSGSSHRPRGVDHVGEMKLLRMRSEPNLEANPDVTADDARWVRNVVYMETKGKRQRQLPEPPSAKALELLLLHYSPVKAQLFGQRGFKTYSDLYRELVSNETRLVKCQGLVHRCVEPVVIRLQWKGYILMKMFEVDVQTNLPVSKKMFLSTKVLAHESWRDAALRTIEEDLMIPRDKVLSLLKEGARDDEVCHSVVEEGRESPSYPGVFCHYRTHIVNWDMLDDCVSTSLSLPVDLEKQKANQLGCDFSTSKHASGRQKFEFWRWVPEFEAQKLQKFLNMSTATLDDRWAKYAFQKEGVVQPPPTEKALEILLRRCGVSVDKFGTGGFRTLKEFWEDLSVQESYLQMSNGQPLRLSEATLLKLRWTPPAPGDKGAPAPCSQCLIQVRSRKPDGTESSKKKLPSIRKQKGESWERSAIRCVQEELDICIEALRDMLDHTTDDVSCYAFFEERTNSAKYPGVLNLYKTYFVSYTLKPDVAGVPEGIEILGASGHLLGSGERSISGETTSWSSAMFRTKSKSVSLPAGFDKPGRTVKIRRGDTLVEFEWIEEKSLAQVLGNSQMLVGGEESGGKIRQVQSVLLGIESAAPQAQSPFGGMHSASGKSNDTSALGNRKWKAYREDNALQIPSDFGGMRMRITREMFDNLREICSDIGLVDPRVDVTAIESRGYPRMLLHQRFAERELFKHVLAGNVQQARRAIESVRAHRLSARKHLSISMRAQLIPLEVQALCLAQHYGSDVGLMAWESKKQGSKEGTSSRHTWRYETSSKQSSRSSKRPPIWHFEHADDEEAPITPSASCEMTPLLSVKRRSRRERSYLESLFDLVQKGQE